VFETMSVGGVSKTAFYPMLSAFPLESGSLGIGLSTRSIQEVLIAMAFNAAARFGTGAELPQPATQTHPSLGDVFPTEAHREGSVGLTWFEASIAFEHAFDLANHLPGRLQEFQSFWACLHAGSGAHKQIVLKNIAQPEKRVAQWQAGSGQYGQRHVSRAVP
jgi:hypothetical protein